jgi:hypothetical protein
MSTPGDSGSKGGGTLGSLRANGTSHAGAHEDEHAVELEPPAADDAELSTSFDPPERGEIEPAPTEVADLAEACVRFVERATGVRLDYAPETLPLLDHWIATARAAATEKTGEAASVDATLEVVAQTAGAYLGEVIRHRHPCWWRTEAGAAAYRLEFAHAWLVVRPVELVEAALALGGGGPEPELGAFAIDDDDREAVQRRLDELPETPVDELVAPSTRLEVLDIVLDAIRARQVAAGLPRLELEPADYDDAAR